MTACGLAGRKASFLFAAAVCSRLAGMQLENGSIEPGNRSPRTSVSSTAKCRMANSQADGCHWYFHSARQPFNLLANDPINYTSLTSVQLGRTDDCDPGSAEDRIH